MLVQAAVLIVSIFENMRLTPRSSFNCQNKDEKKKKISQCGSWSGAGTIQSYFLHILKQATA